MSDTHCARPRQRSKDLSKGCAIILCRPGRRANCFFVFREARRNTPMMAANRLNLPSRAFLFILVLIGVPSAARSSTLEDSAKELARKIATALPAQENVSCEFRNISSLQPDEVAGIEQAFKAELQDRGVRVSASSGATIQVAVTLSENFTGLVWTGEIHQGDTSQVVLIAAARSAENRALAKTMPVTIHSEKFWEGREHILDAATMNFSDGRQLLLLLTVDGVLINRSGIDAFLIFSFPPVQTVLRNPAGTLTQTGNEVTAAMPQQICVFSLNPDGISQCHPTEGPSPGRVVENLQLLSPVSPAPSNPEWGSQIQEVQSPCGGGAHFLVTGPGDFTQPDFVQVFGSDPAQHRPAGKPLSNRLTYPGPVMDLHADGTGARAVVSNLETGNYEAHRISIECGK
jgi:hypothetical protein